MSATLVFQAPCHIESSPRGAQIAARMTHSDASEARPQQPPLRARLTPEQHKSRIVADVEFEESKVVQFVVQAGSLIVAFGILALLAVRPSKRNR